MAEQKGRKSKGGSTVSLVYEMVKPITDELGLMLWDVVFEKEGAYWYLRVYIDREDAEPSMEDCENVTRPLSKLLDEKDPIEQSYILEVGSPGIGRELKREEHFEMCMECPVRIRFIRENEKGEKEIIAALKAYNKDTITVMADGEESVIKLSDTAFVKLADDEDLFDEGFDDE
jgi:ribosome maturation factor RimP